MRYAYLLIIPLSIVLFFIIKYLPNIGTSMSVLTRTGIAKSIFPLSVVTSCPAGPHEHCYEYEYRFCHPQIKYLCAVAHPKLIFTDPYDINGNYGQYLQHKAYVRATCYGNGKVKLYVWYGKLDDADDFWNYVHCNENGCSGATLLASGFDKVEKVIELPTDNQGRVRLPKIICWDYSSAYSYRYGVTVYAWAAVWAGWLDDYSNYWKVVRGNVKTEVVKVCEDDKLVKITRTYIDNRLIDEKKEVLMDCKKAGKDGWYYYTNDISKIISYGSGFCAVEYRKYGCKELPEGAVCTYDTVKIVDCCEKNGWYCKDDYTREYRKYYAQLVNGGNSYECKYIVEKTEKCPPGTKCINGECKAPSISDWIIKIFNLTRS